MKKIFVLTSLVLGLSLGLQAQKPNIILLFSDDAGYADFGFQGSKVMKTPNLDELASEGVRFTNAYVTASVCGPSRAGLLTGRYQQRFGFTENNIPGYMSKYTGLDGENMGIPTEIPTMADYMKQQGYATACFGKWHLGIADCFHPLERGFDEFYGFRGGARSYYAYEKVVPREQKLERNFEGYAEPQKYLTDRLGEETVDFIERHKDEPFFAFVSFNAVHTPMDAEPGDLAEFPELEGNRRNVAAMTLALDRACGMILDKLEELGLEEHTIVVFTNDNGGPSDRNASVNIPLAGTKSNHLEGGIRVPYLMKWPGKISQGSEYHASVSTFDLLPTFYAAAGGNVQGLKDVDGVDIMPFVSGEKEGVPHEKLFWKKQSRAAVVKGDWKLIRYPDRPAELFNLKEDISEQHDLAAENPELVKALFKEIFEWEMTLEPPAWTLDLKYERYDVERMDAYRKVRND